MNQRYVIVADLNDGRAAVELFSVSATSQTQAVMRGVKLIDPYFKSRNVVKGSLRAVRAESRPGDAVESVT